MALLLGFVSHVVDTSFVQTLRLVIWTQYRRLARHVWLSSALLFALPILLRLLLLPHFPAPIGAGADDFGYLFPADTLRHGRLANPPVPHRAFFEQIFLLQEPTRSSIYPLGQGLLLALGWIAAGTPWAGVLLGCGLLCTLCGWMMRGWTTPEWAFAGGLLSIALFGPLCYWTNCYWGGFVSATAGCLIVGALPRRNPYLAGAGFALQLLSRPFEFGLILIGASLFFLPNWRLLARHLAVWLLCLVPAIGLVAAQNQAITGSWKTLPYLLYRYQYGAPGTFTFQPNPPPHHELNSEQELDYRAETAVHGDAPDSLARYLSRLWARIRFYRFFLYAPLYLPFAIYLWKARSWKAIWPLAAIGLLALGSNFYAYFYPHYIAVGACLFLLPAVKGLERMPPGWRIAILFTCFLQFCLWYVWHATNARPSTLESWDYVNGPDPQGRATIAKRLAAAPGRKIVFVHYSPAHGFAEWVHNDADLDAAAVWYVHDLGSTENEILRNEHPERKPWILLPDEAPPLLEPYQKPTAPFEDVR